MNSKAYLLRKEGGWKCVYCGQVFDTRKLYKEHKKEVHNTCKNKAWNKGLNKSNNEIIRLQSEKYSNGLKEGRISPTFLNKHHSDETKKKLSEKEKAYIANSGSTPGRSHSLKACNFIDELNKEKHWNLTHALNGGEFRVGRYRLDGYDAELNIAFEYDEHRHKNNKENDLKRQEFIRNRLKCRFFRYDEDTDSLYEV